MYTNQRELKKVFEDDTSFASTALVVLVNKFGTEVLGWEPDTIRLEIASSWGATPSDVVMNKLGALMTAITTNLFYVSADVYNDICNGLSGDSVIDTWDPTTPDEMAWAVVEVGLSDPPDPNDRYGGYEFSHEVRRFTGEILRRSGFHRAPDILSFAEMDLTQLPIAEDPAFSTEYWRAQNDLYRQLDQDLVGKLSELFKQLKSLPIGVDFDFQALERTLQGLSRSVEEAPEPISL